MRQRAPRQLVICGVSLQLMVLLPRWSQAPPFPAFSFKAGVRPRRPAVLVRAAESSSQPLASVSAVVVGAGPSGLLLTHRLLAGGARVQLIEGRPDPRSDSLEGRAYALGLGMRGRTAIRSVDNALWESVKPSGFSSDRFKLHLSTSFEIDLRTDEDNRGKEPSLLVYQSDLCKAMLQELETRYSDSGRFKAIFEAPVETVDPLTGKVVLKVGDQNDELGPVDIIAGCDGINSVVRAGIATSCSGFKEDRTQLPGFLKVLRFPRMPSALDPAAVHAIPGAGGTSAFIEPTARGACALISWRSASSSEAKQNEADQPGLGDLTDPKEAMKVLAERFPLLSDVVDMEAGEQFVAQAPTKSSTVKCNTYHYGSAVLLGDAAHSTGGASGQGCNSALQDAAVLADALEEKKGNVKEALLAYSQQRVPEGQALLELSLGPSEEAGPLRRALYSFSQLKDTLLAKLKLGEPILQTKFTTSMVPFSDLRRQRDFFFGDFPSQASFNDSIAALTKIPS